MNLSRPGPLDTLYNSIGKRVLVDLNNGWRYVGKLSSADSYINIVLDEAEEYEPNNKTVRIQVDEKTSEESVSFDKKLKSKLGTVFIRGATVKHISVQ